MEKKYGVSTNKLKIELWSSNSTLGYLSKENENTNLKRYMHPMFTAALFTKAKIWIQSVFPSTDEWIKKIPLTHIPILSLSLSLSLTHTHTHTLTQEYYLAIKIMKSCHLWHLGCTKWNKSDKERHILWFHLYTESWKQMNKHKIETELQIQGTIR